MFHSIYSQVALIALVACCGFAIWKGSDAVRAGAVLIVVTWFVTLIASAVTRSYVPAIAFLASDGIMAIGLLFLAVRYSNWWMGAAMLLQATSMALHAAYFAAERADLSPHVLRNYILGKNLASAGLLVIILAATLASVLRRRRAQTHEPATPASAPVPVPEPTARAA
jgi:hypothetical protein